MAATSGLVHAAATGYLWVLERKADSIDFVDGKPFVKHDVITGLDPKTGRPRTTWTSFSGRQRK